MCPPLRCSLPFLQPPSVAWVSLNSISILINIKRILFLAENKRLTLPLKNFPVYGSLSILRVYLSCSLPLLHIMFSGSSGLLLLEYNQSFTLYFFLNHGNNSVIVHCTCGLPGLFGARCTKLLIWPLLKLFLSL